MGDASVPSLCLGTAGHVDHGKTWLVKALTGKDTDRLPEEKRRGISIDLGYARLDLPDGRRLSVIDVPGHERFVHNMVAGATGVDLFLLVVDAVEGPRAQTYEHVQILKLLGIDHGVIAVTKADAVEPAALALSVEAATKLVAGAEAVAVSAKTGRGLDELQAALARAASTASRRRPEQPTRLFVDRVFTLRGIGTVATGTLWSGSIGAGDDLTMMPRGLGVRVRSVQVHDEDVDRAAAGQRVAVSLPGVERTDLVRGDALVAPRAYPVSYRLDVRLETLERLATGARVQVHHGTAEIPARLVRIGDRYGQLRLARPVVAARGDRVILRRETTLGGGEVLDPAPRRGSDAVWLETLESGDPGRVVRGLLDAPKTAEDLLRGGVVTAGDLERVRPDLVEAGGLLATPDWVEEQRSRVHRLLAERREAAPLEPGLPAASLLDPRDLPFLPLLGLDLREGTAYLPGTSPRLTGREADADELLAAAEEAGPAGIAVSDLELARHLETAGRLVRLGRGHAVSTAHYDRARVALVEDVEQNGSITLARFRDLLGISRRPAQLLLERFDADGLTRRVGDERVLRRSALRR